MSIELLDEFAAVLVAELLGDDGGLEAEDVEGVPAEVVAGCHVERGLAKTGSSTDAVPVVGA
jgi:hypothetical protein